MRKQRKWEKYKKYVHLEGMMENKDKIAMYFESTLLFQPYLTN